MIVGNGDIASVLTDRRGAILFASGVSNSSETDKLKFERELIKLWRLKEDDRSLFYFSSIATQLTTDKTPYLLHKTIMESCVRDWFQNYNIIRIGNINWGTNPNTFINFIRLKREKGDPVEIRDEWKYLIHKEQLNMICQSLPLKGKNEICVFSEMKKVKDCL